MEATSTQKISGSNYAEAIAQSLIATSKLIAALALTLILGIAKGYAQAPNISYSSPQVYNPFIPVAPLTPANTGGAVPLPNPVTAVSGYFGSCLTVDNANNFYAAGTYVTKISGSGQTQMGTGFSYPSGIAVDAAGNIFVADNGHNAIKEIVASSGSTKTLLSVASPKGMAVDATGAIYFCIGTAVYRLPAGATSRVTVASGFSAPVYVAVDAVGNVYVADQGAGTITRVLASNHSKIVLATGIGSLTSVAVDKYGNVYYSSGNIYTSAGYLPLMVIPATGGPVLPVCPASLYHHVVIVDNNANVYTDDNNRNILLMPFGAYTISPALPAGLKFDSATGTISGTPLQITPAANYTVTAYNSQGKSATTVNIAVSADQKPNISYNTPQYSTVGAPVSFIVGNTGGVVPTQQLFPLESTRYAQFSGLAVDASGNIYAATHNTTVVKYPPGGGAPLATYSGFVNTFGVVVDAAGNIFVLDNSKKEVDEILASNGSIVTYATGFLYPQAIAIDAAGNLYISDSSRKGIYKVPAGGGTPVMLIKGLNLPVGVAVDPAGNVYYADKIANTVSELPVGATSPIVLASGLNAPMWVAADPGGNVFLLSDGANIGVQRIIAGGGAPVNVALIIPVTKPGSIALDAKGNIYTSDWTNGTIVEANPGYYVNPNLPAGLSIDQSTGIISGTPTNISPKTNYSVSARNSGGVSVATIEITVSQPPPPVISYTSPQVYAENNAITPLAPVTNMGQNTSFSINTELPAGLVFDHTTGIISGTPTAVSPATDYTVTRYTSTSSASATVNIATVASTNTSLTGLALGGGTLSPAFATATTNYTVSVPNSTPSVSVTPTAGDGTAVIRVNGITVASGAASAAIPLSVGVNTIGISVIDNGGTTASNYTISVTRAGNPSLASLTVNSGTLSPTFAPGTYSYSVTMPAGVGSISVTPTLADTTGTISINQKGIATGTASPNIQLALGANNISVVTQTIDGLSATYTINAIRLSANANLSAIAFSKGTVSPAFSANTLNYTVGVANTVASVTVTPTTSDAYAIVKVNGTAVTSGSPSAAIALSVGANIITVAVTAPDGSATKTYTFTVNRAGNNNANLSAIAVSAGALAPAFAPTTTAYTVNVVNGVTSIKVTPTVSDADATITVNGTAVASGSASTPITLSLGANTITVAVTASNGTTVKNYTLTVNRAKSNNANLAGLAINHGTLTPAFSPGTTSFTASVANSVTSMTVVPTSAESTATIKINGSTVASGTVSQNLSLAVGANTISTVVTAGDGTTTKTYTLTVTRAAGPLNIPDEPVAVAAPIEKPAIEDDVIVVHQGISPNGDGINDYLVIDGIQAYPDNKLTIVNRNGALVFETKGYDNVSKKFDGHNNKTGQMQLPGTYFYSLEYTTKGVIKHKTGYLVLKY